MSSSDNGTWSEKFAAIEYDERGRDFVRYQVDDRDDQVGSLIRSAVASGDYLAKGFRDQLSLEAVDTLSVYAERRIVQLKRSASLDIIDDVLNTYGLFLREQDVPWDKWFKGMLYVARSLGVDLDELYRRFDEAVPVEIAERASIAFLAMDRVESLAQCSLFETNTNYGVGFLGLMVFHSSSRGWTSGILVDRRIEFAPTTNIVQVSATLADAMDQTGFVTTATLGQDQLAAQMFDMVVSGSYVENLGCISFVAEGLNGGSTFSVFVAEFDEDTDIEELAAAATAQGDQAAVFDARRLVLISAQPSFQDMPGPVSDDTEDESEIDFHNFEELAQAALVGSGPVRTPVPPAPSNEVTLETPTERPNDSLGAPTPDVKPLTFGGFS